LGIENRSFGKSGWSFRGQPEGTGLKPLSECRGLGAIGGIMKLLFFALLLLNQSAHAIIFANDDRKDVFQSTRADNLGRSIAMMQGMDFVIPQTPRKTYLLDFVLASDHNNIGLCSEEKFSSQPVGYVNCTGFLVAEDILVTAGHCSTFKMEVLDHASPPLCTTFKWIFDFKAKADGSVDLANIPTENIYECKEIIHAEHLAFMTDHHGNLVPPVNGNHGTDFSIIRLDRKVVGRQPLKLANLAPGLNDPMTVIGFPLALPMKYADNAKVIGTQFDDFILTDLDILGGNSGSPVFNDQDEVVGIAVRSFPYEDTTYLDSKKCSTTNVCAKMNEGTCVSSMPGEIIGTHVDRIFHVQKWLKTL
jgi:hypothetical protein